MAARLLVPYRSEPADYGSGAAVAAPLAWVHVCRCWPGEVCRWIVSEAERAADWRVDRHRSVPTTDIEVLCVPSLRAWLLHESAVTLFPTLAALYGVDASELHYLDLFLVRYTAAGAAGAQRGLRPHRDRSLLSFNIALTSPETFEGGGTVIDAMAAHAAVLPEAAGDLVTHCGKLRHAGAAVTAGTRDVLVGFVDVRSPKVSRGVLKSLTAKLNVASRDIDMRLVTRALAAAPASDGDRDSEPSRRKWP